MPEVGNFIAEMMIRGPVTPSDLHNVIFGVQIIRQGVVCRPNELFRGYALLSGDSGLKILHHFS